jgi:addiction module RelE/StbE family toxin
VARLALADGARRDLERLVEFLLADQPTAAEQTYALIINALRILEDHPLMGRGVEDGLRELIISRGRTGYIALYDYLEADDLVVVLALRHQREAGFPDHG